MTLTSTALYPFHRNTAGDFWTSASVRDHTIFGSTYPEFLGLSATDTLVGRVNALYGGNATSRFSWETARAEQHVASPQSSDVRYQYSAVIRAQHMGPGGVSKVLVFLDADMNINARPASTQAWMSEPGLVGYAGFQNAVGQEKTEMQTNGVVALTAALEDRMRIGELRSMDENVVGTYLQEKLHWLLVDVRLFDPANSHACRYLLTLPTCVRPMTMSSLLSTRPASRLGCCGRRQRQVRQARCLRSSVAASSSCHTLRWARRVECNDRGVEGVSQILTHD